MLETKRAQRSRWEGSGTRIDYSLSCNTKKHESYVIYAIFMIICYVAVLPAAMTWFRWREHQSPGSSCYKPSFWWFDTYDLFYRLTMTGFLLVISRNSDKVRMIASTFVAIACLFIVMTIRPFLQESHNAVLTSGQAVVGMTVFCGFVLESGTSVNEPMMGWVLIVMNVCIVIISLAQQLTEKLHTLLDSIHALEPSTLRKLLTFIKAAPVEQSVTRC